MNRFMEEAVKEGKKGIESFHGGPFGAVVVKDDVVIGRGHNMVVKKNNPILHGEIVAIQDACKRLKNYDLTGAVIYTTSEPCPMCLGAILWANIKKVYYGCNDDDADKIGFRDRTFFNNFLDTKNNIAKELNRKECLKLFDEYYNIKSDKKKRY